MPMGQRTSTGHGGHGGGGGHGHGGGGHRGRGRGRGRGFIIRGGGFGWPGYGYYQQPMYRDNSALVALIAQILANRQQPAATTTVDEAQAIRDAFKAWDEATKESPPNQGKINALGQRLYNLVYV